MRNLIRTFGGLLIILLITLICWNLSQSDAVRENAERSLNRTIEQTVEEVKVKGMYKYNNAQEMQADFIKCFAESDSTAGSVRFVFYGVDVDQGLLDVRVTKTFKYPTGQTGQISVRKTVFTEEYER